MDQDEIDRILNAAVNEEKSDEARPGGKKMRRKSYSIKVTALGNADDMIDALATIEDIRSSEARKKYADALASLSWDGVSEEEMNNIKTALEEAGATLAIEELPPTVEELVEEAIAKLDVLDVAKNTAAEAAIKELQDNPLTYTGTPGVDGKNGRDGANGTDGKDGLDGSDGEDGKPGKDGSDGTDGADGRDGRIWPSAVIAAAFGILLLLAAWIFWPAAPMPLGTDDAIKTIQTAQDQATKAIEQAKEEALKAITKKQPATQQTTPEIKKVEPGTQNPGQGQQEAGSGLPAWYTPEVKKTGQ